MVLTEQKGQAHQRSRLLGRQIKREAPDHQPEFGPRHITERRYDLFCIAMAWVPRFRVCGLLLNTSFNIETPGVSRGFDALI